LYNLVQVLKGGLTSVYALIMVGPASFCAVKHETNTFLEDTARGLKAIQEPWHPELGAAHRVGGLPVRA
jgi:hypothetical protein